MYEVLCPVRGKKLNPALTILTTTYMVQISGFCFKKTVIMAQLKLKMLSIY